MSWWYPFLRGLADAPHLTVAERAQADQTAAAALDLEVARAELDIAARECSGALTSFVAAWQAAELRADLDADEEVATHPDLVELNVQMDGWYDQ